MKLYYSRGTCALAPHILLREAGVTFEIESVHLGSKQTKSGQDFLQINPKGYVPALVLDDGQLLTEVAVVVQYIADQFPAAQLAAPVATLERYRAMEWLNYIASEVHKRYSTLFSSKAPDEYKTIVREDLTQRLSLIVKVLEANEYMLGRFGIVDAYLYSVLRWSPLVKLEISPVLQAFIDRMRARPAVQAAMEAEGIKK